MSDSAAGAGPPRIRYVAAGTLQRPGPVGRAARLALGIACAWVIRMLFAQGDALLSGDALAYVPGWWPMIVLGGWFFPDIFNIGWGVSVPRRTLWVVLLLAGGAAAGLGAVRAGTPFAGPLGVVGYVFVAYTYGHLGLALLVAAVLATPGCEMRSLPQLLARIRRGEAREHYCLGMFTPLDRWEAERGRATGTEDPPPR